MIENRYMLLFLLIHLIFSIIVYLLHLFSVLRSPRRLILLTIMLPVWGGVMTLIAELYTRKNKEGTKEPAQPLIEEVDMSTLFRPLFLEEADQVLVPLEEALVLEDPSIRRHLMLELIQEDPKRYISLLKKVRIGDDPEVSHYASTAIMQIQREYELDLQKKEQTVIAHPIDKEEVQPYLEKLKEYIKSDLLADNAVMAQRRKLNTLLVQILSESGGDRQLYLDAIDNLIELKEFSAAESLLKEASNRWESDESFFLLKLRLYHKVQNGWALNKEIKLMKESGVYLSPKTREIVEFWSR